MHLETFQLLMARLFCYLGITAPTRSFIKQREDTMKNTEHCLISLGLYNLYQIEGDLFQEKKFHVLGHSNKCVQVRNGILLSDISSLHFISSFTSAISVSLSPHPLCKRILFSHIILLRY